MNKPKGILTTLYDINQLLGEIQVEISTSNIGDRRRRVIKIILGDMILSIRRIVDFITCKENSDETE